MKPSDVTYSLLDGCSKDITCADDGSFCFYSDTTSFQSQVRSSIWLNVPRSPACQGLLHVSVRLPVLLLDLVFVFAALLHKSKVRLIHVCVQEHD